MDDFLKLKYCSAGTVKVQDCTEHKPYKYRRVTLWVSVTIMVMISALLLVLVMLHKRRLLRKGVESMVVLPVEGVVEVDCFVNEAAVNEVREGDEGKTDTDLASDQGIPEFDVKESN